MKLVKLTRIDTRFREDEGDEPIFRPVFINPMHVRTFAPRLQDKPGTRLTFIDGGGYAVKESVATILSLIGAEVAENTVVDLEAEAEVQRIEGMQH